MGGPRENCPNDTFHIAAVNMKRIESDAMLELGKNCDRVNDADSIVGERAWPDVSDRFPRIGGELQLVRVPRRAWLSRTGREMRVAVLDQPCLRPPTNKKVHQ